MGWGAHRCLPPAGFLHPPARLSSLSGPARWAHWPEFRLVHASCVLTLQDLIHEKEQKA